MHGVVGHNEPERRNYYRTPPNYIMYFRRRGFLTTLKLNSLNVYKFMGYKEAHGDINHLPSLKTRMTVSNSDEKGFRIRIHSTKMARRLHLGQACKRNHN